MISNVHNKFWASLAEGSCIYCAAPLFSPMDRVAAANIAGAIQIALHKRAPKQIPASSSMVFLPYRDTSQAAIQGNDRAQQIFDKDIDRLNRMCGMAARVDGLVVDTGVAMEIGYASGKGTPIALLKTDFMGESFVNEKSWWPVDPVLSRMSQLIHHMDHSPEIERSYFQTQVMHENDAISRFAELSIEIFETRQASTAPLEEEGIENSVYVDIMGGRYEWARAEQHHISDALRSQGFTVFSAGRYEASAQLICEAVETDILNAQKSRIGIFSGDGPEMDSGSAALLGFMFAKRRKIVLQYTSPVFYAGSSGQTMRVNLMVERAATAVSASRDATIELFAQYPLIYERK